MVRKGTITTMKQVRTFIAIELNETINVALADLQEQLKAKAPRSSVRWVKPEGIHLTLKFLGDVPVSRIEEVERALTRACAGFPAFYFSVGRLGCFPDPRRPVPATCVAWASSLKRRTLASWARWRRGRSA
jgi:2'-5' RNA ligase